tara:strand:- start:2222 stop:2494 length:273 start_codon:yes stop_codon:yes gene_type:complete
VINIITKLKIQNLEFQKNFPAKNSPKRFVMAYRELSKAEKVARWFNQRRIGTAMLHKKSIRWFQKKTGLSNYQIQWLAFAEGVIITIIIL